MEKNELIKLLDDLSRLDDILACMVARQGLDGIVSENIKINDPDLWRLIRDTTDTLFTLIDKFYGYGLNRLYFELGDYTIIIAPISPTFSLLVVISSLANMGLLDVEIENTKRKIVSDLGIRK